MISTAAFQDAFETAQRTIFFELVWSYLPNVAAGEDIGIVTAPEPWPGPDFWMFDDQRVWLMHYDQTGTSERVEDASAATTTVRTCLARKEQSLAGLGAGRPTRRVATTPPRVPNGCIGGCA